MQSHTTPAASSIARQCKKCDQPEVERETLCAAHLAEFDAAVRAAHLEVYATDRAPLTISVDQLRALVAALEAEYPAAGQRVQHAAMIVLFRRCEQGEGRGWWVQSERDDDAEYIVLDGMCTCQDYQRHGQLSPCKHQLSVKLVQQAERFDAEAHDPTPVTELVDVSGEPIPYSLTPQALAYLDEHRIRNAARCPDCGEYKQHGDLTCGGDRCPAAVIVLNLPA